MKSEHLVFVHLFNDFSGSPRVLADAIEGLDKRNKSISIFTSSHNGFLSNISGTKLFNIKYKKCNNKYLNFFYYLLSQLDAFIKLIFFFRTLEKNKTLLIVNTMLPFGALLAGRVCGVKVVCYVHETAIKPKLLKIILRFFIKTCSNYVVFVSKYLMKVEKINGLPNSVIYNGLRQDFMPPGHINYEEKFASNTILLVASLKVYKGIYEFIELAKIMPDYNFVAALNCHDEELKYFIDNNDLSDNIELLARPDSLQSFYERASFVLNLSRPEGWIETFGLSILEGMSFGCVVIAPKVGAPPEFVDKSCGLLANGRDLIIIKDFIRTMDFETWFKLSKNAKIRSDGFSNSKFTLNFNEYINKCFEE